MRNRVCSNFLILINTLTFGECGCYDWQPQTKDKQAREADQWDAVSWHHQAFCTLTSSRPISLLHLPRVVFADTVTPAVLNQALLISPNVVSNFLQKPSADFFTHEMCSSQEFYWKLFLQQTRPNRGFLSFSDEMRAICPRWRARQTPRKANRGWREAIWSEYRRHAVCETSEASAQFNDQGSHFLGKSAEILTKQLHKSILTQATESAFHHSIKMSINKSRIFYQILERVENWQRWSPRFDKCSKERLTKPSNRFSQVRKEKNYSDHNKQIIKNNDDSAKILMVKLKHLTRWWLAFHEEQIVLTTAIILFLLFSKHELIPNNAKHIGEKIRHKLPLTKHVAAYEACSHEIKFYALERDIQLNVNTKNYGSTSHLYVVKY